LILGERHEYLGGVDAVSICLATRDPDELVRAVELIEPAFGAINLEDIAQPKCFRARDLAVGGGGGRRPRRGDGPQRLSQPTQQLAGLPGPLPGRTRRAGAEHQRRDGDRGR
jgi:hypothetical protein